MQLKPRKVLTLGCGYHEFKGKIDNLIGIDPYNSNADIEVKLLDYHPTEKDMMLHWRWAQLILVAQIRYLLN